MYTQTRAWLNWLIGFCEDEPVAVEKLEFALEGLTEVEKERDEARERIADALELCSWASSSKEEIAAALQGRLAHHHPIMQSRRSTDE